MSIHNLNKGWPHQEQGVRGEVPVLSVVSVPWKTKLQISIGAFPIRVVLFVIYHDKESIGACIAIK